MMYCNFFSSFNIFFSQVSLSWNEHAENGSENRFAISQDQEVLTAKVRGEGGSSVSFSKAVISMHLA